ncbi:MAG: flavin reductase family protein [Pseudomonadota bacterium]
METSFGPDGSGRPNRAAYHDAMSRLGASVSIVTTAGPAGRCGLTVSSATSVSDDPPIVLVCINRSARTCDVLTQNGVFAVNVLAGGSEQLADAFAGRFNYSVSERFGLTEWNHNPAGSGAPILPSARVTLDCALFDSKDTATHRVVFGEVVGIHLGQPSEALVYLDRRYVAIGRPD